MGLFSLIAVLMIEQIRPMPYRLFVHGNLSVFATLLEKKLNAGEYNHGMLAWLAAVGGAVLLAGGVHVLLSTINPLLAWIWSVLLLYLAMGYGEFSQLYARIQMALRMDDLAEARRLLSGCLERPCDGLSVQEIARLAIEAALVTAHRHFFAVLVCFVLLPGPCGAVLYRVSAFLADTWGQNSDNESGNFGRFSRQAFAVIDWLPARLTATAFAVVGNFEDAIFCWRARASGRMENPAEMGVEIVLASAGGALGVRFDSSCAKPAGAAEAAEIAESCPVREADTESMQNAVGLIWRAVVLCLLLLTLFRFARLVAV